MVRSRPSERFVHRHLPYLLARASHALWLGFEPQVRAAGLNSLEWRVLATLSDSEPLAVGALALEVLAKQPTLTKSLDRMAAQGWVERQPDPADARRARVRLTAAGRAKVDPLLRAAERHQRERLAALGLASPDGLQQVLQRLLGPFDGA
jgi:MarR family transcriptional regulator, lower aerobic nicotinate degradation pathway regulator